MDRGDVCRALAEGTDLFFAAVRAHGEALIEEYRARAGVPDLPDSVSKALVCMSSAVDEFVAELESGREIGGLMAGGRSLEEAEKLAREGGSDG